MEDWYDAAPIPDEEAMNAVFAAHEDEAAADDFNLDLSAHSSASDISSAASSSNASGNGAGEHLCAAAGSPGAVPSRHKKQTAHGPSPRKIPQAALDSPGRVVQRLTRSLADADQLLARMANIHKRHSRNDFVAGERCENSGCAIVGYHKLENRIRWEFTNAQTALGRLRNAFPSAFNSTALEQQSDATAKEDASDPELRALLVKAQQLADSNSLGHLNLLVRCLETEENVVGVFAPIAPLDVAPSTGTETKLPATTAPATKSKPLWRSKLEVDIVAASGLRWIKVRCAALATAADPTTHLSPEEADFVATMQELRRRAGAVKFAFFAQTEVCVLFGSQPSLALAMALTAAGVRVASVSEHDAHAGTTALGEVLAHRTPFFDPKPLIPSFICLDTTALVCLCSETCYPSELPPSEREENLKRYKVLSDQIRSETQQPAVREGGAVEVALRQYTRWDTMKAFEQQMEMTLMQPLPEEEATPESTAAAAAWRRTYQLVSLSLPETAWCDTVPQKGSHVDPPVECEFLCEVDAQREQCSTEVPAGTPPEALQRPNWIVTDITLHEFRWMIETIAGRCETIRAQRLLRNLMVVDTSFLRKLPAPCEELAAQGHVVSNVMYLPPSSKVQQRNRVVFATADALRAITLTANKRVVNSAREHGIHLWARLHPSRSLTELYMHRERRHAGPTKPPPFEDETDPSKAHHCV